MNLTQEQIERVLAAHRASWLVKHRKFVRPPAHCFCGWTQECGPGMNAIRLHRAHVAAQIKLALDAAEN